MYFCRAKREREREPLEVEDETTQTSSPGGWQGRLSAFLHVHRGSRASSRKSSRASDASDISELGGPWLNLPLLLLSSAANVAPEELDLRRDSNDVSIRVSEPTPEATTPTTPSVVPPLRRRSIYNFPFFLKHQDAVENTDDTASPPTTKKSGMKGSSTSQSLHPAAAEDPKPKRGSLIRRKSSTKSRKGSNALPVIINQKDLTADVSILVTEPSPEAPVPSAGPAPAPPPPQFPAQAPKPPFNRQQSESTVVHVLVHRESEEYNVDDDDGIETAEVIIVPERPRSVAGMASNDCVVTLAPDKHLQDS